MRKFFNLIIVLLVLTPCQAQKTEILLNLEKGKKYTLLTDSKVTIIQEIDEQKVNISMTIKGSISFLVKAVNDKDYEMEVNYESLSMSMKLPQGSAEFSSEKNDEQDTFSMILAQMINKPFEVRMTKYGKITEVKNITELFDVVFSKFSHIPEDQISQIKAQLMKAYGEDAFKGNIEMVTAIYPQKRVAKGDTWAINTKLESGMSANISTTYKLAEKAPDYFLIVGDSQIKTADKDAYVELNGMPVKYDLIGNMLSVVKIDKVSGWIIEAKVKQDINGDVYIKENPQMPDGMKIPMTILNDMTFTNY